MGFYKEFAKEHDFLATWKERTPKYREEPMQIKDSLDRMLKEAPEKERK